MRRRAVNPNASIITIDYHRGYQVCPRRLNPPTLHRRRCQVLKMGGPCRCFLRRAMPSLSISQAHAQVRPLGPMLSYVIEICQDIYPTFTNLRCMSCEHVDIISSMRDGLLAQIDLRYKCNAEKSCHLNLGDKFETTTHGSQMEAQRTAQNRG